MNQVEWIHVASTDSTNSLVRRWTDEGRKMPDVTVVYADEQTAGRGQRGNSWESAAGQNVQFSLVCHPLTVAPARQFVLSEAIALAVADAVQSEVQGKGKSEMQTTVQNKVQAEVKWPNDIYVGDRKISGTLIECDLQGRRIETCIIGTGINVNQRSFVSDAPNPVSLRQLTGREHDRGEVLEAVVNGFMQLYELLQQEGGADRIHDMYRQRLYRRTGRHRYEDGDGMFEAAIADVEPSGHLLLRRTDGRVSRYDFKEVKFVIS